MRMSIRVGCFTLINNPVNMVFVLGAFFVVHPDTLLANLWVVLGYACLTAQV